jgi:hypothetical protein
MLRNDFLHSVSGGSSQQKEIIIRSFLQELVANRIKLSGVAQSPNNEITRQIMHDLKSLMILVADKELTGLVSRMADKFYYSTPKLLIENDIFKVLESIKAIEIYTKNLLEQKG